MPLPSLETVDSPRRSPLEVGEALSMPMQSSEETWNRRTTNGLARRLLHAYADNYILLITTSAIFLTLSGTSFNVVSDHVSVFQILACRSAFCLVVVVSICWWQGYQILVPRRVMALCFARGITGASAFMCWAFAMYALPLSEASFMTNSYPVVTAFLSWMLGREELNSMSWAGAIGCAVGNALMAHPSSIFGDHADFGLKRVAGLAVAALSNFFIGSTFLIIGVIGKRIDSVALTFYMHLCSLLFSIPFMIAGFPKAVNTRHSVTELLCYAGACVSGLCVQFSVTRAFQLGPPTKTTALYLSNMVFAAFVGIVLLGDEVSLLSILGSFMIGISVLTVVLQRSKKDHHQTSPENEQEQTLLTEQETDT